MSNKKFTAVVSIYWFLTLSYMGLIFYLSSLPSDELKISVEVPDYFLHTIEYCILSALLLLALNKGLKKNIKQRTYFLAFVISLVYGIFDEIHQSFVPTRQVSIYDIISDMTGALLAVGLVYLYTKKEAIFNKLKIDFRR